MYDLLVDMILPVITSPMKGANNINLNDTIHQLAVVMRKAAEPTFIIHHSISPCHLSILGCPDIIYGKG
jgi:hypothetical protein